MNRDRVAGGWKQFSGSVQEQWSLLVGDQSGVGAAQHTQLAGRIQARRGMSTEDAARQLKEFLQRNRDWDLSRR